MSSEPPPALPAVEGTCAHRRSGVELGNEWNQLSRAKARATRAGDTAETGRLRGQLRAIEAAVREQYTACRHAPEGDRDRRNKGIAPDIRDEATQLAADERADPGVAERMDTAINRAETALTSGQRQASTQRRQRQCGQPTRTPPHTADPAAGRSSPSLICEAPDE